jgi:hypothetical protein
MVKEESHMKDSPKPRKKRPKLVESFNNVPNLLEEARQAVDEVTQTAPGKRSAAKPARRKKPQASPPKKSAPKTGRQKKPAPAAAPPEKPATAAAPRAPATRREPLRALVDCGISVKHAIPGRIRLRLHKMLHNEALAAKLPALLATVPGVTAAEASTATGSLLITFRSRDLAEANSRQKLAGVMHQFFPGLDTETLVKRMLRA